MSTNKLDLSQPELPPPNEKLLRAPTFFEKYSWLKSVFIVAIIVILVDVGIYLMLRSDKEDLSLPPQTVIAPTTQPIANTTTSWQTYVSPGGNFLFKYPAGSLIKENTTTMPYSVQLVSASVPNENTAFKLTISYKTISPNQPLENLIAQNKLCPDISPEKGTPSLINGEKRAQLYIDAPCGTFTKTVIYTINNNTFYMISIDTQAKYEAIKTFTDQILSTLQFTEPQASQIPSPSQILKACPLDARVCPDGSSVGRGGPNCEFTACPKM